MFKAYQSEVDFQISTAATVSGKANRNAIDCSYIRPLRTSSLKFFDCLDLQGSLSSGMFHNCSFNIKANLLGNEIPKRALPSFSFPVRPFIRPSILHPPTHPPPKSGSPWNTW